MSFNIDDWYWRGKPTGQATEIIYGSARHGLVEDPKTDPAYLAHLQQVIKPSPWPTDEAGIQTVAALDAELVRWGKRPTGLEMTAASHRSGVDLVAYANAKLGAISAGLTHIPPYIDARLGIASLTITTTAQIDALAWPQP